MLFHSEKLDWLIHRGLVNNPTLAAAKAALLQAQENLYAQIGTLLPTLAGNFSAERERFSGSSFGTNQGSGSHIFNLYNANVSVAYTLDVFGGLRRQIESTAAK